MISEFKDINIVDIIASVVGTLKGVPKRDEDGAIVVDEFNEVVYTGVKFQHGEGVEVFNTIQTMADINAEMFPLIYLEQDIQETKDGKDRTSKASLNVFIITPTRKEYDAESRKEEIFKPILTPIYEQFISALTKTREIERGKGQTYPPHKKTDSMFWGKNNKLIANGFLDVLEIRDLELTFVYNCKNF